MRLIYVKLGKDKSLNNICIVIFFRNPQDEFYRGLSDKLLHFARPMYYTEISNDGEHGNGLCQTKSSTTMSFRM